MEGNNHSRNTGIFFKVDLLSCNIIDCEIHADNEIDATMTLKMAEQLKDNYRRFSCLNNQNKITFIQSVKTLNLN